VGLETGTFISDLVVTNPPSGDLTAQGDDHIRLIKTVLKNTFPGASKAIAFPTAVAKTLSFSIASTDQLTTFLVDTTGGIVAATLPSLSASDAGWECYFVKSNTGLNPILVTPPSGTIQSGDLSGLATTRRCIPGAKSRAYWTGSNWYVDRAVNVPVGTVLDFDGATLPVGYEWPNGQTLASAAANYPDYNARKGSGVTRDLRGRIGIGKDDMGGAAAGRVTNAGSGVDGLTLGAAGGSEFLQAHLHNVTGNTGGQSATHTHPYNQPAAASETGGATPNFAAAPTSTNTGPASNDHTHPVNINSASVGAGASQNMPPGVVMNKILVVE
jgi:hypothetical protein